MAFATDAQRRWFFAHFATGMRRIAGKMRAEFSGSETKPSGAETVKRIKRIKPSDPGEMTAGEINKALDKLDKLDSQFSEEMIAAGRGHEAFSEWSKMTDPLASRGVELYRTKAKLRNEIERRMGPGATSRLPRGFGPIRKL